MIVDNDGVDFSTTSLTLPEGTATEYTGKLFSAPANTVTGYGSVATAASVVMTDVDGGTAGVSITPTTLDIVEGAAGMYTVALGTQPTGEVLVMIAADSTVTTAPVTITPSLVLTFTPTTWETAQTVTVSADEDADDESGTRTLVHTVTGYTGVSSVDSVTVNVTDNDGSPMAIGLSLNPDSVTEGDSATTSTSVMVTATLMGGGGTRTEDTVVTVSVTGDGTGGMATAGAVADSGTDFGTVTDFLITIPMNTASATGMFTLEVVGDTLAEGNETVTVSGTVRGSGFTITPATLTITDNDPPTVSLGGETVDEDVGMVTVTATLSGGVPEGFTVDVSFADGRRPDGAVGGFDYTLTSIPSTLSFTGTHAETRTFTVAIADDMHVEPTETFSVSLVNLAGTTAMVAIGGPATITIIDNDALTGIELSLSPDSVIEGSGGSTTETQVTVTARLAGGVIWTEATEVTVSVAGGGTGGATAGDVSQAGTDFAPVDDFDISIPAGLNSYEGTFTLEWVGDTLMEANETITVSGSADIGAVARATATVDLFITNDDHVTGMELSLSPDSVTEGRDGGTATTMVEVTATLTGGGTRTEDTVVTVSVAGGGTNPATAGGTDFATVDDFMFSIPSGTTSFTGMFPLEVVSDTLVEGDETLTVTGSANLGGGGSEATATVELTITDDDTVTGIGLSLSRGAVFEDSGTTTVTVTAALVGGGTRTAATAVAVTVAGGTATAGGTDFDTVSNFNITIPQGMTSSTGMFDLVVADDTDMEGDETVTVTGSADLDGGGTPATATADLTIIDDESTGLTISRGALTVTEGGAQQTYTVRLNTDPTATVTDPAATATVTIVPATSTTAAITAVAMEGGSTTTTLRFDSTNWQTPQTVTVGASDDDDAEGGTVTVAHTVQNYPGVSSGPSVEVTVIDNDTAGVSVTLPVLFVPDGEGGTARNADSSLAKVRATVLEVVEGQTAGQAGTSTYTVMLDTQPIGDATVTIGSDGPASAPVTIDPSVLTFTPDNWETGQLVTVTADTDGDDVGGTVTVTHVVGNYGSVTSAESVEVEVHETWVLTLSFRDDPMGGDNCSTGSVVTEITEGTGLQNLNLCAVDLVPALAVNAENVVFHFGGNPGDTAVRGTDYVVSEASDFMRGTVDSTNGDHTIASVGPRGVQFPVDIEAPEHNVAGPDRFLTVTATHPLASFRVAPARLTIVNNDTAGVTIDPTAVTATEEGTAGSYTVALDSLPAGTVTVDITVGTAGATAAPVTITPTQLTFTTTNWNETQTVTVAADMDDNLAGGTRILTHTVTGYDDLSATPVTVDPVTVTVMDTAAPVAVLLEDTTVTEGDGTVTVNVTLDVAAPGALTVTLATMDGTATTADGDYTALSAMTTVEFAEGDVVGTTKTVTVPILDDSTVEEEETLTVMVSAVDSSNSGTPVVVDTTNTATVTITDDDDGITLSLAPGSVSEGDGSPPVAVTASFAGDSSVLGTATVVAVAVEDGTATAATDVTAPGNIMVTIPANTTSGMTSFNLPVTDDTVVEGEETLTVSGTSTDRDVVSATLTVTDNDDGITLSLTETSVSEGDGSPPVAVTASFAGDSSVLGTATVVAVAVEDGTATAATDVTAPGNIMVTIPANTTSGMTSFNLPVTDDTVVEGEETLTVSGTSTDRDVVSATLTVTDNDDGITLSLTETSVSEGDGSPSVAVTASFTGDSSVLGTATVVAVSVAGGGSNAAVAGTDFTAVSDFMVTIDANTTSGMASFNLPVADDTVVEGEETLTVSGISGALAIASATLTVTDNDDGITLSLTPASVSEGDGSPSVAVTASFAGDSSVLGTATVVAVSVAGDTAVAGTDFTAVSDFMVTIDPRATSGMTSFNLPVTDDTEVEEGETLTVSGTSAGRDDASATLTITDNDGVPAITLGAETVGEGDGTVTVTATLAVAVTGALTVTVVTADDVSDFALQATAGTDYTSLPAMATVVFPAGSAVGVERTFTVAILEDTVPEWDETFRVRASALSGAGAAGVSPGSEAIVTITSDDPTVMALSVSPESVAEGAGPTDFTFTATFAPGLFDEDDYETILDTVATTVVAGADYSLDIDDFSGAFLALDATTYSFTASIDIQEDTLVEPDEFLVWEPELLTHDGVTWPAYDTVTSATITFLDDDILPTGITLGVEPMSVPEGSDGGTVTTTVTVTATLTGGGTRAAATAVAVSVAGGGTNAATAGAVADSGTDFGTVSDFTLTIPSGTASFTGTFDLVVVGDTLAEGDETLTVTGSADLPVTPAELTIADDDTAPTQIALSLSTDRVDETSGTTAITVTAAFPTGSATRASDTAVTVSVAGGGTNAATPGTDFDMVSDITVTIPMGMTSATGMFDLVVTDDTTEEAGGETVTVTGTVPPASGITSVSDATLTINDDDSSATQIALSLSTDSVAENSAPTSITVTAAFVGSNAPRTSDTAVTVSVGGGTAPAADFTAVPAFPVTILAGATSGTMTFDLTVVDNNSVDGDRTLSVSGTTVETAVFTQGVLPAELTITDDEDTAPTQIDLSLSTNSVAETSGMPPITVTAAFPTGNSSLTTDTEVMVSVAGGTATAGTDFTVVPDFTVTISAGATSGTAALDLTVADNNVVDGDRTVTVSGTTTAAGFTSVTPVTLTITDEDTAATMIQLSLNPASVGEDSDTTAITVTAAFPPGSSPLGSATDVTVSVVGGTATAGTDFNTVADFTVTIPARATEGTGSFDLTVTDDTTVETGGETVRVGGAGGIFTVVETALTINDDEVAPTQIDLTLSTVSVAETSGTTSITVTAAFAGGTGVTLGTATDVTVSVAGGGTNAATAGTDFTAIVDFTVTISAGATSGTAALDLTVVDNDVVDGSRTVTVSGTTAATGITSVTPATLTITDEDTAPTEIELSLTPTSVDESGTTPVTVRAAFPTGSASLTTATDVTVSVAGGTATVGTDFNAVGNVTVRIPARATEGTGSFNLTVRSDTEIETGGETVTVSGTAGTFTIADATLTINDDDSPPTQIALTLDPSSVTERSGTTAVTVTAAFVGSTGTLATSTEVAVSVAGGGTSPATAGAATDTLRDFTTVTDFTVTIPAGSTRGTGSFNLEVYDDNSMESAETLTVSGTTSATGFTSVMSAELTITANDDAATGIALSLDTEAVAEASGTTTITVTATLAPPDSATATNATTVTVSVAGGTAEAEADFTAVDDFTITIPIGTTSFTGTFDLVVINSPFMEPDETVTVSGSATGLTVTPASVTINDDDSASAPTQINLALSRESVPENIGTATVTVTASFPAGSPAPAIATAVEVTLVGDTATAGTDFDAVRPFTVTIPANAASGTASFELVVTEDTEVEGRETLTVQGESAGYTIAPVTLAITDGSVEVAMEIQREFAKEVFNTVSTAIANRVSRLLSTGASVPDPVPSPTRGRTPTSGSGFDFQTSIARELATHERDINDGSLSWQKVLDQSSFEFQLDDDADTALSPDGGLPNLRGVGIWAAAEGRVLSDDEGDSGAWDGEVFSGHVGADIRIDRGVGGLAVSSSRGSFDFEDGVEADTRFLNYSLYGGMPVGEASSLRAAVGYGTGEIEGPDGERDMTMTMGILGGRTNVAAKDGLTLAVEGELWIGQLDSESVGGAENSTLDTRRFQLGLDLTRARQRVSGVQITQGVQLDLRHDGGDGETGSGAGIEGRLGYADPVVGLTATVTGDFLLYHESGLEGGGVGGSILYRPEPAGRGLSFRTDSSYSASREDISRLWEGSEVVDDTDASEAAVFGLETGYGVPALGGYALLTPYYAFEFTRKDARHHRLGGRLQVRGDLELELEGGHRGNVPDHGSERRLDLRLRMTW